MEVYGYVYMVRNKVNGKIYFGITEDDFDTRYRGDIGKRTGNEHLKSSIKKYGIENFEINEQFDVAYNEDDLWDLEDMYICLYNTLDRRYGYNKQRSGSKHKGHGKHSEESKRKNSEAHKGKKLSEEHKRKISEAGKGRIVTNQTRQKISEAQKGKKISEETKHKISEAHQGKKASEETKRKFRETRKGDGNGNAKTVICIETGQIFTTVKDAKQWLGKGDISACCKGKWKSAGKHPITGEKLHWMYYDEYLEQQNKSNSDSNNNKVA